MSAAISRSDAPLLLERRQARIGGVRGRSGSAETRDRGMLHRPETVSTFAVSSLPGLQRSSGFGRLRLHGDGGATRLAELYQAGALRLRIPHTPPRAPFEAIAINTAGGLTGGDRLDLEVALEQGTAAVVTTPACEKVYRSSGGEAQLSTSLKIGNGSRLDWLPQPMIMFDGGALRRALTVEMAADATLLGVEALILGRTAMAEDVSAGSVHDGWRIRRDGRLVYADAFRAGPQVRSRLAGRATLRGARALATVVYVAPDAAARLNEARRMLADCGEEAAASAWDGLLVVRFVASDGRALIDALSRYLTEFRAAALPRSWAC